MTDDHAPSPQQNTGATRRRGPRLEHAILDAARDVLVEQGYDGFTYEAVAARAGTSRPVLYRRWPQRDDLLLATVTRFWRSQPIACPDTGSLRRDAIAFLEHASARRARMIMLVGVQLMDYFRKSGTSFSELRAAIFPEGGPTPFEVIVDRAVKRGELAEAPRPPRVMNLPFDLLRHEMLMTMREVPGETIADIVDHIWLPLLNGAA